MVNPKSVKTKNNMGFLESACIHENGDYYKVDNVCCIKEENKICIKSFSNPPPFVIKHDEFTRKNQIAIYIVFAILYGFVLYLLIDLGTFQAINVGITVTFALLLIQLGKKMRKSYWLALLIGLLLISCIALPLAVVFFATGEYIWEDYGYFDFVSHFLAGFFIFFFLAAILKEKNLWKILLYAMLIEIGYECVEIMLDVVLNEYAHLEHLHWNFYNMLVDLSMHFLAGLISIAIFKRYNKKSNIYMDTPIFK